tara:strand:+ start:143 stop:349 length:207 start_codon:yes stop_codon:yes gene_type:complete
MNTHQMKIGDALKWTDQAEVGQTIVFEENADGTLVRVILIGATHDEAMSSLETLGGDWQNPTDRLIVK